MLRLRLAGIPVEVHISHMVFIPMLALFFAPRSGWAQTAPVPLVVAFAGAVISSVIIMHELGYAFAARAFGYRPVVQLIGMSGRTLPNPNETIPWHRDVILHLAGPAMGLTLGFTSGALYTALKTRVAPPVEYGLLLAFASHLLWATVNLLPIHPLKGGRIATAVMMRMFGKPGFLHAQVLGLFVGVSIAGLALAFRQPFGVFALIYVAQTAVLIAAYRRGELPRDATHPLEQSFARARALYKQDQLDQALLILDPMLEADLQPQLRGRVHVLLGWLALKLGQGRRALDHFSQCPGIGHEPELDRVPPHALAAAFSLIGDDARAVPLWEQAARTGDPTLLHELAGALIRAGRDADARRLPNVHLPAAYQAAQRVLWARSDFEGAARIAEARFAAAPTAACAYDAACAFARANRPDDAVRLLALAAQHGFRDLQQALNDDELSSLRAHAGFSAFLEGLRTGPRN